MCVRAPGYGEVIQCRSNQQEARPPEVKASCHAAGGSRCEAVTASVGSKAHGGKKLIKTNWRGGNPQLSERNDVCSLLKGSSSESCIDLTRPRSES